jgi:hypothetical protein
MRSKIVVTVEWASGLTKAYVVEEDARGLERT